MIRAVRAVRARDMPIIMIGGQHNNDNDLVEALDAGADDYVLEALSNRVLLARISALRRRMCGARFRNNLPMRAGPYELNSPGRFAMLNGRRIAMTPKEFDLATLLFANAGRILASKRIEHMIPVMTCHRSPRAGGAGLAHAPHARSRPANGVTVNVVYAQGYRLDILDQTVRADLTGPPGQPLLQP